MSDQPDIPRAYREITHLFRRYLCTISWDEKSGFILVDQIKQVSTGLTGDALSSGTRYAVREKILSKITTVDKLVSQLCPGGLQQGIRSLEYALAEQIKNYQIWSMLICYVLMMYFFAWGFTKLHFDHELSNYALAILSLAAPIPVIPRLRAMIDRYFTKKFCERYQHKLVQRRANDGTNFVSCQRCSAMLTGEVSQWGGVGN